ncbi:MAG TPA: acireductone synthase [Kofleriaceae bacterium]|nr:acireductone synthase [Kofleriaceae bacterium]
MKAIVTDIEGTTSSIAFVHDVLFPYARRHLPQFVRAHQARPDVAGLLDEARALAGTPGADVEHVIRILIDWIDQDRKATPLKELQGLLWIDGYAAGAYRGHIYPEVGSALRRWHAMGIALYVYSSGSVAAQKLLFAHSEVGDLTPVFAGYFDTRIGAKREPGSYTTITQHIAAPGHAILFLSDVVEELDAARAAGLSTTLVCRESLPPATRHPAVTSFDAIDNMLVT